LQKLLDGVGCGQGSGATGDVQSLYTFQVASSRQTRHAKPAYKSPKQSITKMSEIHAFHKAVLEFNRNYLSFANRLIREDRENAKRLLGLTDEMTSIIGKLTPEQIDEFAASDKVVCGIRVEEVEILLGL
jgi:flagellar transcriptional activator FlhD